MLGRGFIGYLTNDLLALLLSKWPFGIVYLHSTPLIVHELSNITMSCKHKITLKTTIIVVVEIYSKGGTLGEVVGVGDKGTYDQKKAEDKGVMKWHD